MNPLDTNESRSRKPLSRILTGPAAIAIVVAVAAWSLFTVSESTARNTTGHLLAQPAPLPGESGFDRPPSTSGDPKGWSQFQSRAPGDTLSFGNVDGDGFAVLGEVWTFDNGGPDPLEGWYAADVTAQTGLYWRHINDTIWGMDLNNEVAAPVLSGIGSAWLGAMATEANDLCWEGGLGYGNDWCQRLVSPTLVYDGVSDVELSWLHFNDTEPGFDETSVYLETLPSGTRTELRRYDGMIGITSGSPPVGATDSETLVSADFDGETSYRIVFEMVSDGGWSDSDALHTTEYGPAGFDDVSVDGNLSTFETDLDGWVAEGCPAEGSFFGVAPLSDYVIEDACECELAGNVLEFHDDNREHPYGQRVHARSAPVDVLNDVSFSDSGDLTIFARWWQYSQMPQANGVFYRPGWDYYPFTCPVTGGETWSGRVGSSSFFFVGNDPVCTENADHATDADVPVSPDAEQVRFIFEVYSSCDAFSISEAVCTDMTNFTPLVDNVTIRVTTVPDAPQVSFGLGTRYADGFAQGTAVNDPSMPGNADVTLNVNFGDIPPIILGDSTYVSGPLASSNPATQWEAKLWFRVPVVGPLADSRYTDWRDRVADGRQIEGEAGEFTFAFMDSFRVGTNVTNNKYISYFREDDDDFDAGAGQLTEENEIIADGVLFPGTKVEYFVSSNYIGNPQSFLQPDTAGGFALEFEILPRWRDDGGVLKYPCLLYVDAYNAGAEHVITGALETLGVDYDKFDYLDAGCCWAAPMARGFSDGANAGMTLAQSLGYRSIILNTGSKNITNQLRPLDCYLLSDWLTAELCEGATARRGLIMNGDGVGTGISDVGVVFLNSQLGADPIDFRYVEYSGDGNYCVRLEAPAAGGESYGTSNSAGDYEYDAWGNWCPSNFSFDVLAPVGPGVGNRVYLRTDDLSTETAYAQITTENLETDNYRTIIDGVSYHHLSMVDPVDECSSLEASILEAATNELRSGLEWIFGVGNLPGLCEDPCTPTDSPGDDSGPVVPGIRTHLQSPSPNPFNPRTTLRFGLAQSGQVDLAIYDVGGRRVRTLVDGPLDAGDHEMRWDGTDDSGRELSAGIYWMKLRTGGFDHAARVVRLK